MNATSQYAKPVFELNGLLGRIDLSAWLSGASFAAGLWFCNGPAITADFAAFGIGFRLILAGFALFLASVLIIQRHMRLSLLANTFGSPRHLVTSGIFRYSRNPIYVAFLLPLAALAYFSCSAAIAAIALYIWSMNLTVIRKEERDLAALFGAEYAQYCRLVPRWVI